MKYSFSHIKYERLPLLISYFEYLQKFLILYISATRRGGLPKLPCELCKHIFMNFIKSIEININDVDECFDINLSLKLIIDSKHYDIEFVKYIVANSKKYQYEHEKSDDLPIIHLIAYYAPFEIVKYALKNCKFDKSIKCEGDDVFKSIRIRPDYGDIKQKILMLYEKSITK